MALSSECKVHDWSWDPSDEIACPVCHGIGLGKKQIIKLLKDEVKRHKEEGLYTAYVYIKDIIRMIKAGSK